MIKRLLNSFLPTILVAGLLGPSVALCLPAQDSMPCCAEACPEHQSSTKTAVCCQPAAEARPEPKIFRAETAALAACPPVLFSSQAPALPVNTALLERLADAPPTAFSGLSPPRPA